MRGIDLPFSRNEYADRLRRVRESMLAADIVLFIHSLFVSAILVFPFMLHKDYLIWYVLLLTLMVLQWKYIGGCVLTHYEAKLRKSEDVMFVDRFCRSTGISEEHSGKVIQYFFIIVVSVVIMRYVSKKN